MYPDRLIQSSDYATLANDSIEPIELSVTVPNGSSATVSASATINITASPIVFSIRDNITGDEWATQRLQYVPPNGQSVGVTVRQTGPNTVTLRAQPLVGAINGGSVTFTARIRSFVPPLP